MRILRVEPFQLAASQRSTWSFVEIASDDGFVGVGETTVHLGADRMHGQIIHLAERLMEAPDALSFVDAIPDPDDFVDVSARSGLNQALVDIAAQRAGKPIWNLHTSTPQDAISVYANINRRTRDRSPQGFAESVKEASARGMTSFKIAPFDGLLTTMSLLEAKTFLDAAYERIFAVREAIGDGRLMVDCHWRLNEETFASTLAVAEQANLFWIECPYPEEIGWLDTIRKARRDSNMRGIYLAGLELKVWEHGFKRFIEHECYDVLMPDIKHVGGYERFYELADAAQRIGVKIAPHNPTGPISHAHSVMASSAIDNILMLEMQFDETRAFGDIVEGHLPMPVDGKIERVDAKGLGLRLSRGGLAAFSPG